MRGACAAGAVIAAVTISTGPATADTPSTSTTSGSSAMDQYQQLSSQADTLNEQLNGAQNQLKVEQGKEAQANADLATAKAAEQTAETQEDNFRATVDGLTAASFEGARVDNLSALLTGSSARDFLDRATDLQSLADDNYQILSKYQTALDQANTAAARAQSDETAAQDAINTAQSLVTSIQQQSVALNAQISQVITAISHLSPADQASLLDTGPNLVFVPPPGARGEAMMLALGKRGSEYVWGASGPKTFDCSGLIVWAYGQLGITLPHYSGSLAQMGTAVSRADLEPGDLVFFGSPVHHVGIYVGNGDMVDAPETGQVVKVQPIFAGYSGARRLSY
jgi:cell wall-associated NlpC family hydrolase